MPAPTVTTAPPVSSTTRCVPASDTRLAAISDGLTVSGGGSLSDGWAVKSTDYVNVWFVAARIHGPGMDGTNVGIWATHDPDTDTGTIMAVGAFATQFSDWGDGSKTKAEVTTASDGARDAERCSRQDHA
jgi:hypothetical protein